MAKKGKEEVPLIYEPQCMVPRHPFMVLVHVLQCMVVRHPSMMVGNSQIYYFRHIVLHLLLILPLIAYRKSYSSLWLPDSSSRWEQDTRPKWCMGPQQSKHTITVRSTAWPNSINPMHLCFNTFSPCFQA